jgi:hypothetical protein
MAAMTIATIAAYRALGRALRLSNGAIEAIVTLDVGPRVMHVSLPGGPNMFADDCAQTEDLPDGSTFAYLGGHRVWHSPEAFPRSYVSDSHPLARHQLFDDGVLLVQEQEPWTQIEKSIELRFREESIVVTSRLTNGGAWTAEMAVWSLFLGSPNGRLILPVVQRDSGLLPNTSYVLWPYSRMDDPRVRWGRRFVVLDHDEASDGAIKLGYADEPGWLAYCNNGCCLVKTFRYERGARYPDGGCSAEAYSAGWGIDIESLSPLRSVEPGQTISHEEEWAVFACPRRPATDDEIAAVLAPLAERAGFALPAAGVGVWDPKGEQQD